MEGFRTEHDSIGEGKVPSDAYYGIQALRASRNFRISGQSEYPLMIRSMAEIKLAAASVNCDAGRIEKQVADAIISACGDVIEGKLDKHFIVDPIQGGAGTSLNMNANEVIANRALEILGKEKGDYKTVHPNDHVNCGQSTNDVYPSAGRITAIRLLQKGINRLDELQAAWDEKAKEARDVLELGRTELQDAVPVRFGEIFHAYATSAERDKARFQNAIDALSVINMGGTAIGTGITASPVYRENIVPALSKVTGISLKKADDMIDATQNADVFVYVSGIVKSCAVTLSKIAHDLRLLSSGPRAGFGELKLKPKQNGSSIMPGKVNPVIPELINEIAFQIIGNDAVITHAAEAGQLELNAFEPIIFHSLFISLHYLCNGLSAFITCIKELAVDEKQCRENLDQSVWLATAVSPRIGYEEAAKYAKRALREHKKVSDLLVEDKRFTEEELDALLRDSV
ncbi:MAG: aspartate ammonia-lyase [Clostridia bacterium]|nr:aspartate ammonia-lyase [Clostridia bacterium]